MITEYVDQLHTPIRLVEKWIESFYFFQFCLFSSFLFFLNLLSTTLLFQSFYMVLAAPTQFERQIIRAKTSKIFASASEYVYIWFVYFSVFNGFENFKSSQSFLGVPRTNEISDFDKLVEMTTQGQRQRQRWRWLVVRFNAAIP